MNSSTRSIHSEYDRMHGGKGAIKRLPSAAGALSTQTQPEEGGSEVSGEGTDENDGSDHGLEADEEADETSDADASAPSDRAIDAIGLQTGLTTGMTAKRDVCAARKRLRSPTLSDDQQQVGTPKRARTHAVLIKNAVDKSDDDDYNGVDLISDSEEEDPTVEQLEERIIIDSEEENTNEWTSPIIQADPTSFSSDGWEGFGLGDGMFLEDVPFFDEQIGRTDPAVLATEIEMFDTAPFFRASVDPSPPPRRVHFADAVQHHSDSTSTFASDFDEDTFPDMFLQQENLDPAFRQMIENENDGDDGQSITDGEKSYWVYDEQEDGRLEQKENDSENSDDSYGSSSGYETDEGETTDEEVIPPSTITRPQSLLRRSSLSSFNDERVTTPSPVQKSKTVPVSRRYGPSMGSWIADPTKPIAVIDSTGKHMVIIPAQRPVKVDKLFGQIVSSSSSTANDSPRASFTGLANAIDDSENDRSDFSGRNFVGPMLGAGTNLMMPGLLHGGPGSEQLLGGQVLGPPEAFYPFTSIGADGNVMEEQDDDDDDDGDGEDLLNVHDFIDFGDDSSGSDHEQNSGSQRPHSTTAPLTRAKNSKPSKSRTTGNNESSTQSMLDHFDKGVVSAFRRNQHRHHTALRRPPINISSRGSSAIKGGRHIAANTLISPVRKRRLSNSIGMGKDMGPPSVIATKRRLMSSHKKSQR